MKRGSQDYWCFPQPGGHRTLYFLGHESISRSEYIDAVGAADCDPHIMHGRLGMATKRKTAKRKPAAKRELIDTGRDKRFIRRRSKGRFKESDDVGRSLAADRRKKAKKKVPGGQGDKGDRKVKRKAKRNK
jgi:hypothetical protein